ncbi:MAG: YIP1 family protein [Gemmatimonadota bacterium]|jgi:hypothetical protein
MPEQPFEPTPTPPAETPPSASMWEDFIDIFYAPSSVFERRRGAQWWPVLVILAVVLAALFFLWHRTMLPVFDLETQRQMATRAQQMTPEQIQNASRLGGIFGAVGILIVFPIGVFLVGLLLWGLGRAFGAAVTLGSMMLVATYAQIVRVPQYLAGIVQSLFLDVGHMDSIHDVSLGLDRFMNQPDTSAALLALASRVELFTLWATILLAIGLHVIGRIPKARAYAVAFLIWALATIPAMLGGLLGSR